MPKLVRQPSGPFGRCDPPEGAGSEPPPTVAGRWRHHIAVVTGGTLRPPASLSQPERLVRFRASPQDFTHCFRAPRGERRGARSKGARHEGRGTRGNEPGARHRGGQRATGGDGQRATGNRQREAPGDDEPDQQPAAEPTPEKVEPRGSVGRSRCLLGAPCPPVEPSLRKAPQGEPFRRCRRSGTLRRTEVLRWAVAPLSAESDPEALPCDPSGPPSRFLAVPGRSGGKLREYHRQVKWIR